MKRKVQSVALTLLSEWALLWQFSNARQLPSNFVTLSIYCNTKCLVKTNSDFIHKKNAFFFQVEKSIKPVSLLEHLILLCATRNTAACALTSISETKIPKVLKVRRVAALGLKVKYEFFIYVITLLNCY